MLNKQLTLDKYTRQLASDVAAYVVNRETTAWAHLHDQYKLSNKQIANAYGICEEAVRIRLKNFNLANRSSSSQSFAPPSQAPAINHATACVDAQDSAESGQTPSAAATAGAITLSDDKNIDSKE